MIAAEFGLTVPPPDSGDKQIIKKADDLATHIEATVLLKNGTKGIKPATRWRKRDLDDLPALDASLPPHEAEKLFREAHDALANSQRGSGAPRSPKPGP